MDKAKFVKMVDGVAEYEIVEKVPKEITNGKEYKAEKIERRKTDEKKPDQKN